MNFIKHIIYCFGLYVLCFQSLAQDFYPAENGYINTISLTKQKQLGSFNPSRPDSSINHFQNYFNRNTNGHLGLPSSPIYINSAIHSLGFRMLQHRYENDFFNPHQITYYQTKGPYATLTGIAGSKQEQVFKMLFSNSFKNKLNLTLAFNRYSGIGFYQKQQSFTNNFYTTSNYSSTNKRIGYYAYFLFNKVKHQENGGLAKDTLFLENIRVNKFLLPIQLSNARREYRNTSFNINPWFRLNKNEDSTTVLSHILDYDFNYSGTYTKYSDPSSGSSTFYQTYYLDTASTKDSTHWRSIQNSLNYNLKINPLNSKLKVGYQHEINQFYQYSDSISTNQFLNAGLYTTIHRYTGFLRATYIFNGANSNDYQLEFNNVLQFQIPKIKTPLYLNLNLLSEKRHADYLYNSWYSNHFQWSNNFSPIDKQQAILSVNTQDKRFNMGILFQNFTNYLYLNDLALPTQISIPVQNFSAYLNKDFLFLKHIGLNIGYRYQQSSEPTIVSIPNHIGNSALYYQGNLFKKVLQLQIGFNIQYYSEFYGYAYSPILNQYHTQYYTQVGNYPFVDFFLNARIKPVRIFFKIDHLNQGFTGSNYGLTPGYLQADRAFKFGLNWLFFD
ncbi:MAG: hypothetical protein IT237_09285 [Bacteroidia bacterium]|nr:hypothetical protein [Bacteroidia bacterium]